MYREPARDAINSRARKNATVTVRTVDGTTVTGTPKVGDDVIHITETGGLTWTVPVDAVAAISGAVAP